MVSRWLWPGNRTFLDVAFLPSESTYNTADWLLWHFQLIYQLLLKLNRCVILRKHQVLCLSCLCYITKEHLRSRFVSCMRKCYPKANLLKLSCKFSYHAINTTVTLQNVSLINIKKTCMVQYILHEMSYLFAVNQLNLPLHWHFVKTKSGVSWNDCTYILHRKYAITKELI